MTFLLPNQKCQRELEALIPTMDNHSMASLVLHPLIHYNRCDNTLHGSLQMYNIIVIIEQANKELHTTTEHK